MWSIYSKKSIEEKGFPKNYIIDFQILACAPSNIAIDNIGEKLSKIKNINYVRIGHPARIMRSVIENVLDVVVSQSNAGKILEYFIMQS